MVSFVFMCIGIFLLVNRKNMYWPKNKWLLNTVSWKYICNIFPRIMSIVCRCNCENMPMINQRVFRFQCLYWKLVELHAPILSSCYKPILLQLLETIRSFILRFGQRISWLWSELTTNTRLFHSMCLYTEEDTNKSLLPAGYLRYYRSYHNLVSLRSVQSERVWYRCSQFQG